MKTDDHRTTGRVLDIIELVSSHREGLTFSEIVRETALPKGSLYPLLRTLRSRGYLALDERTQRYRTGETLFAVGNRYVADTDLTRIIQAVMRRLSEEIGETVYFGVLSGGDVLYLLMAEAEASRIRLVSTLGFKWGAYATGFGKALLSQFDMDGLERLYPNGLKPLTERTITDLHELFRQGEETRRTGFAYEIEESTPEVRCVAVPIIVGGTYLAGMSAAVPVFRWSDEKRKAIESKLAQSRAEIERIIGANRERWIYS